MNFRFDPYAAGLTVVGSSGDEAYVICPFHEDHNQSATFNMNSGWLYCFACGAKAPYKDLAESLGYGAEYGPHLYPDVIEVEDVIASARVPIDINRTPNVWSYLVKRGVKPEVASMYGTWANSEDDRIVFGYDDSGYQSRSLTGKEYRNYGKPGNVWPTNATPGLWDTMIKTTRIFLVEGAFGALRGLSAGVTAISCMGAGKIVKALVHLRRTSNAGIYAMMDDDMAGRTASAKALARGVPFCKVKGLEPDELTDEQWQTVTQDVRRYFSYGLDDLCLGLDAKSASKIRKEFDEERYNVTRERNRFD